MFGLGLVYLQGLEMFILTEHDGRASKKKKNRAVGGERPLTDAALVTALCVGDLSCQGKPPEERKRSHGREFSLSKGR